MTQFLRSWVRYNNYLENSLNKRAFKTKKKYLNTKMRTGTHFRDHVMIMENYFNEAELHGSTLDEPTQVSIILNSLPKEFNYFISSYAMHKLNYGMSQLLNELQTYESICGLQREEVR